MPSSGTRVYVGRIPRNVREYDVERRFKQFGRIKDIMLKLGYAFIEYDDPRDAEDAVYEMNGRDFLGDRILVEIARGNPRGKDRIGWRGPPTGRSEGYEVNIKNISSRMTWQDLKAMMKEAGDVIRADVDPDKREGICFFASRKYADRAVEKFNGTEHKGRKWEVSRRSFSRSLSRSRSRSRSRSGGKKRRRSSGSGSRSRSGSRDRKRKRSSRSKSPRRSKRSKSRSPSKSKSRSKSPGTSKSEKKRSPSPTAENGTKDGRKRSKSGSPEKNADASPEHGENGNRKRSVSPGDRKSGSKSPD